MFAVWGLAPTSAGREAPGHGPLRGCSVKYLVVLVLVAVVLFVVVRRTGAPAKPGKPARRTSGDGGAPVAWGGDGPGHGHGHGSGHDGGAGGSDGGSGGGDGGGGGGGGD